MSGGVLFTIDCEDWNHGLHLPKFNGYSSINSLVWLLHKLEENNIKAVIYMLGLFKDEYVTLPLLFIKGSHIVKSHGYYHYNWEEADRKPYSFLGFCGGFYFRLFPYWLIKLMVKLHGQFYIHPHDLDEEHPKLKNPIMNFKRHVGLKTARAKLERLLKEVKWACPEESLQVKS